MFKKVLIANRGEIALRIIRACQELDCETIAVYSEVDRNSLHVRYASEAYCIGEALPSASYLNMEKLIHVAEVAGADAVHPGYGFLAENADFAALCEKNNIAFIGPSSEAIRLMGDKVAARKTVSAAGVPTVPGSEGAVKDLSELKDIVTSIGFPCLLKAVGGGGGKGIRVVQNETELERAYEAACSEAGKAFGNPAVYVEKNIYPARHIEVQVIADTHGNVVHLGERECSIQRRHQKLLEEAPSPSIDNALREKLTKAACDAVREVKYVNAGTLEFLVSEDQEFYFLEMNTRLQVEHPVTEMITRTDIVREQIRVASGEKLSVTQEDIVSRGHSIEVRICAEDPDNNFLPSVGTINDLQVPGGPYVRFDSCMFQGMEMNLYYDSLLAKLVVWGRTRERARHRLAAALKELHVSGLKTTHPFFVTLMQDLDFIKGNVYTHFIDEKGEKSLPQNEEIEKAVAAAVTLVHHRKSKGLVMHKNGKGERSTSLWKQSARTRMLRKGPVE